MVKKFKKPDFLTNEKSNDKILTPYFRHILLHESEIKFEIPFILKKFNVFRAGDRFQELIVESDNIVGLLEAFAKINVAVKSFSLWCMNIPENRQKYCCPHGGGGPVYKNGYLAPMFYIPKFSLEHFDLDASNPAIEAGDLILKAKNIFLNYFERDIKKEVFYSPCLVPGFGLLIPSSW